MFFMPGPHRLQRPGIRSADAIIDGLLAIGHPVLTFDPPGSGRSLRPAHLGFDEMIGCTDEVLDRFKVGAPIDAIGHGMGGLALLAYTLVRPDRIRRLVLVGTGAGGYLNAPGALWNASHSRFRTLAALGLLQQIWPRRGPEQILRNFVERESFVDRGLAQPVAVAGRDWLRPRIGRTDWHRFAREVDLQPRLAEIAAPTLVLCGMHDPQFPLVCSLRLVEGIPQSRLVTFLDSGHYPFIEEASSFWAAVDRFLAVRTPHVEPRVEATGAVAALASGRRVGAAVG
jgi:pimeloyl-ACP methyl ester carboxylesterase